MKGPPRATVGNGVEDWLLWRSSVSPDMPAVKSGSVEWTYEKLHQRVSALSALLLSWGTRKGDRVALLLRPSNECVALVHALTRIGAVVVPLNHRQSGAELASQLVDSGPSLVVYDDALRADVKERAYKADRRRLWKRAADLTAAPPKGVEPFTGGSLDPESLHSIVYTSGSSGVPKGVELTVSNVMWNAISFGLRNGASVTDRWLLAMPLFHVGGYTVIFRSVLHGSAIVIHPGFDAERVSRSIDEDEITLASFVPTMLAEVLDSRGEVPFPASLRLVFLGGARPPESLVGEIRRRRLPVALTYGMTETCSQVALSGVGRSSRKGAAVSAYRTMFPSEVAVKSPRGGGRPTTRPGEVGELMVRGPTVFRGYWRDRRATNASFEGPWFLTGDLGFRTGPGGGGGFVVVGRKDEMVISGGEHVYPSEVESSLREHVAVKDAVVVGRRDPMWGQRVEAVVELKEGYLHNPPTGPELTAFLKHRIASYKVPKAFHFWDRIPRTPTSKVKREEVTRLLESDG